MMKNYILLLFILFAACSQPTTDTLQQTNDNTFVSVVDDSMAESVDTTQIDTIQIDTTQIDTTQQVVDTIITKKEDQQTSDTTQNSNEIIDSTENSSDSAKTDFDKNKHDTLVTTTPIDSTEDSLFVPEGDVEFLLTQNQKQKLRFGIDAERLWFWYANDLSDTLAALGVKELKSEFVRVAINCAYEREDGVYSDAAYDKILNMMTAMRKANPNILFFASPRPLDQAYTDEEKESIWGGTIPWAPVPSWIMTWKENGQTEDGKTKWKFVSVDEDKLARYYADYLNFMYDNGFDIAYLDVTNEKNNITPEHCDYLYKNIPKYLNAGVPMPKLVAPSAWNYQQGINYLQSYSSEQQNSYAIASCHNTNKTGEPEDFVATALSYGKEPWETELHGWVGIDVRDEVVNSRYFFEHINAGFVGLDSWLFYGPKNGKDHTMIWANWNSYTRSSKYEIYKKVVNNANGGNYLEAIAKYKTDNKNLLVTGFIKDTTVMIWVLNDSKDIVNDVVIDFGAWNIDGDIEMTVYSALHERSGSVSKSKLVINRLAVSLEAEALYCFKATMTK